MLHAWYCYVRLFDFFLSISSKHQFIQSHFHLQRPNWEVPPKHYICVCVCMHAQLQNCNIAPGSLQSLQTMKKNFQRSLSKVRSPQVAMWGQFYWSNGPDASGEGTHTLGDINGTSAPQVFFPWFFLFFPDVFIPFRLSHKDTVQPHL